MLNENPDNIQDIVDAIIAVHCHPLPYTAALPPGVLVDLQGLMTIDYGYGNVLYGKIQIIRDQFAISAVTTPPISAFTQVSYNYQGVAGSCRQDFINALKCIDLTKESGCLSSIIYLTAESCRSELVYNALNVLMQKDNYQKFNTNETAAMTIAIKNYGQTAAFKKYKINAGQSPWARLKAADYTDFFATLAANGSAADDTAKINALSAYVAADVEKFPLEAETR